MDAALKQLQVQSNKQDMAFVLELMKNPVAELAAGTLFINWLTMPRKSDDFFQGVMRGVEAPVLFASLISIIAAQQLSPLMPYLGTSVRDMITTLPGG